MTHISLSKTAGKTAPSSKRCPQEQGEKHGEVDYSINKVDHRSELLPPELLISRFFEKEAASSASRRLKKLEELSSTYGGEDMLLAGVSNDKESSPRRLSLTP